MGSSAADRSRPAWPLAAATLVVPTVLAGITLLWPRTQIEDSLSGDAAAALAATGLGGSVTIDGRDATISGIAAERAPAAIEAVQAVSGIRAAAVADPTADSALAVVVPAFTSAPAPAVPATPPSTVAATPTTPAPTVAPLPAPTPAPAPAPAAGGELDAAAKQQLQASIDRLLAAAPITFGPDSPQLTRAGRDTVGKLIGLLQPGARVRIDGYVAAGPGNGRLTAQQLSDRRAATVRDVLVSGGVAGDHVTARGLGEGTGRRVTVTVV